ncbi:MAG: sel1 repeat family protein [Magnetospirillum sp.]|nr:MAG: sel1 repeat family protein [Magnetospirillum sp.]
MTNRPLLALMLCALLSFPLAAFAGDDKWMAEFAQAAEQEDCPGMTRALAEGASRNEASAIGTQGLFLLFGRCGSLSSQAAAEKFRQAASMGDSLAMLYYATLLDAGEGVKRDPQAAELWGRRAVCRDLADGVGRNLGKTVIGATVEQPDAPAFLKREFERLIVIAANPEAALEEADAAEKRSDLDCACHWRWAAARKKNPMGMRELGLQLLEGRGVAQDLYGGWSWLTAAARTGDVTALIKGAEYMASGQFTNRRAIEAYTWLVIAERAGADMAPLRTSLADETPCVKLRELGCV